MLFLSWIFQNPLETQFALGNDALAVQFGDRVYFFDSEDKLRKFMGTPWKYAKQKMPGKIPPKISRIGASKLAEKCVLGSVFRGKLYACFMLFCAAMFGCRESTISGYLEQALSDLITKALSAIDQYRATLLHPALTVEDTSKAFVALYLKAHNPGSTPQLRDRAQKRLNMFLEECSLADKIKRGAAVGSAISAARTSPRLQDVSALGEQFDKLRREPKSLLLGRFLRPDAVK